MHDSGIYNSTTSLFLFEASMFSLNGEEKPSTKDDG